MLINDSIETIKLSHEDVTLDYTMLRQFNSRISHLMPQRNMKKISVLMVSFTTLLKPINRGGVFDGKSIVCHRGVSYPWKVGRVEFKQKNLVKM